MWRGIPSSMLRVFKKDFKKPKPESYSKSLHNFKLRTLELANWMKWLKTD